MNRLRHWLFNFAAAVSLVLCLAMAALWARSYFIRDALGYGWQVDTPGVSTRCRWDLHQENGDIGFRRLDVQHFAFFVQKNWPKGQPGGWQYTTTSVEPQLLQDGDSLVAILGFAWRNGPVSIGPPGTQKLLGSPKGTEILVSFPHWAIALPSAILPAWSLIGYWRLRAVRAGYCAKCGYDLRATPQRCPECGTIPEDVKGSPP